MVFAKVADLSCIFVGVKPLKICISVSIFSILRRPHLFSAKSLIIKGLTFSRPHVRPHVTPHLTPHVRPHVRTNELYEHS